MTANATHPLKPTIDWADFEKIDIRSGIVIKAEAFPEAKKPAIKVWVDFGPEIGIKKTSAQIADLYTPEELTGRKVTGVVNFPVKQIGTFISEFLLTGFYNQNGHVVLTVPDKTVAPGSVFG